mmetsp:Transcript_16660/g.22957  ORF Transcript_16660/g.22957 Transcript_16660/m.22957 type:complete len:256 (+) Transcript_16660:218-985(+)|eukprot:CAMPEP_0196571882 /NCGR_PEP_ID=MMETSP1081-20130531/2020_1 /TAXON_ID=36882 /ORGANISM="Pyramimonas amylifera, Strain CCMP720" /LENGTH=255 /DNA_ID=CAMNT_0041889009 /DNA_START=154 /DNA_END=921 /DNA_ORIENTATION=-
MVDYTKWDKMQFSDEEDDDLYESGPRVTRVEPGQQINIGGTSWSAEPLEANNVHDDSATKKFIAKDIKLMVNNASICDSYQLTMAALSNNGEIADSHCWSQTKDEVVIQINVPKGVRARDVGVSIKEKHLKVSLKGPPESILLNGVLLHPTEMDEDLGWELLDWPLESDLHQKGGRRLQVTLTKCILPSGMEFSPGESVVVWWRSLLEGGTQIDLDRIQGRKNRQQMQDNWAEAQEMFRQKVKDRKPIIIDPADC